MILIDSKLRTDILEVYEKIYKIYIIKFPNIGFFPNGYIMEKILEILDAPEDIKKCFKFKVTSIQKLEMFDKRWEELQFIKC